MFLYFFLFIARFMVSMSYYVMKLNMNNLSGDRFLNMFYGGLTEFGATLIFYLAVQTRGRRQSYMGFMGVTAVLMTIASLTVSRAYARFANWWFYLCLYIRARCLISFP